MLSNDRKEHETMPLKEAAHRMGVSLQTARRAARRGDIPAIIWGRSYRVLKLPFEELMRGRSVAAKVDG